MRGFLWCQGGVSKGKAKVSWEVVCLPKDEGGLGVRRLDHFNKALMISHIWKLLSLKESLWVRWIHAYKLKGRSFWDIPYRGTMSWGWRKILQLRPLVREFFWHNIGDGSRVLVSRLLFEMLFAMAVGYGLMNRRDVKVPWFELVWFCNCIPRHAVNLWLIIKRRLKTQDLLRSWDVAAGIGLVPFESICGDAICGFVDERNIRLFKGNKRSVQEIIECTMTSIRLKLLSCRLKKSNDGVLFARL
ncbi:reverse transcriptase domain-containing protein [Tanacetum coccineum]